MALDRKALKQRMKEEKANARSKVKAIMFPLPDLRGPGGNAFALLGQASAEMKRVGISEAVQADFHSEATSGEYPDLLRTLQEWFTVVVPKVDYVPLGDIDITSLQGDPDDVGDWSQFDEDDDQTDPEELGGALDEYEATAERDRKIAEVQDRINREVRQDLGLEDDDVVIVKVVKAKKAGA